MKKKNEMLQKKTFFTCRMTNKKYYAFLTLRKKTFTAEISLFFSFLGGGSKYEPPTNKLHQAWHYTMLGQDPPFTIVPVGLTTKAGRDGKSLMKGITL